APHSSQFHFDNEAVVSRIHIGVGDPLRPDRAFTRADRTSQKLHRRANFAHGHLRGKAISALAITQAPSQFILSSTSGRFPLRARNSIEPWGAEEGRAAQPQWVPRGQLNLR